MNSSLTMKGYHPTLVDGRWYVASPSGQTIVAGWFDSEEPAKEYAHGLNAFHGKGDAK